MISEISCCDYLCIMSNLNESIDQLVSYYHLSPHPEGGYYSETYRSSGLIASDESGEFPGGRSFGTAIYFLLRKGDFSAFHRIKSDEIWHFYAGGPLVVHMIHPNGNLRSLKLGADITNGESFQLVVPAGCWFASEPLDGTEFSFVGCTVAPGFDFSDFELAERDSLVADYPEHSQLITRLTRV